jgi:hypothetical protein
VVDPHFGERLTTLPLNQPVWIIDSEENTAVAREACKQRPNRNDHLTGITTFKSVAGYDPEEELITQLGPIDLHHGDYSADPPYSILQVVGCTASPKVRDALAKFGFQVEESSANGFRAIHASTLPL